MTLRKRDAAKGEEKRQREAAKASRGAVRGRERCCGRMGRRGGATIGSKWPPRRYANKSERTMKYHLLTAVLSNEKLEVQVEKKDPT